MKKRSEQHAVCMILLAALIPAVLAAQSRMPVDYLPKFPQPEKLYVTADADTLPAQYEGDAAGPFSGWAHTLLSAAGLAALDVAENNGDTMIWIHSPGLRSYTLMFEDILRLTGAERIDFSEPVEVIHQGVRDGFIKGYIVYRADQSARRPYEEIDINDSRYSNSCNVAASLAPVLGGIIVEERAEPLFRDAGLVRLLDVRDRTEKWCFEKYRDHFSRDHVHLIDPRVPHMRDYAIASRSFCCFGVRPFVGEVFDWLTPNAPSLGWNAGDEYRFVSQLSRHGHFTTASNWIMNLPVMSTLRAGEDYSWRALTVNRKSGADPLALRWTENRHYTSFVMTDGDNLQWFLGQFAASRDYWAAPRRGDFAMGWPMPVTHMSQAAPALQAFLARTATANDQAISFPAGYYYADEYGMDTEGGNAFLEGRIEQFADRLAKLGIRVIIQILQDWDSEAAKEACGVFARRVPGLTGILAMQYAPYNAGQGAIYWVENASGDPIPVVSPRYCIWSGLSHLENNGPPALIARRINQRPAAGLPDNADWFDWTAVHAWSRFHAADPGEDVLGEEIREDEKVPPEERLGGLDAAAMCVDRLDDTVAVVTPEELLWRIRLTLKPRETLDALARDLVKARPRPAAGALIEAYRTWLEDAPLETAEERCHAHGVLRHIAEGKLLDSGQLSHFLVRLEN
jgi:hypothetical protein